MSSPANKYSDFNYPLNHYAPHRQTLAILLCYKELESYHINQRYLENIFNIIDHLNIVSHKRYPVRHFSGRLVKLVKVQNRENFL